MEVEKRYTIRAFYIIIQSGQTANDSSLDDSRLGTFKIPMTNALALNKLN